MQNNSLSILGALLITTCFGANVMAQTPEVPTPTSVDLQQIDAPSLDSSEAINEKTRQLLDAQLADVNVDGETAVNFPARSSLGALELTTLPGIRESLITGPSAMEQSVSKKDLPSEQLLGRITPEVFQEMADLERGNVFLKLQMQKEQLKNDLEKLKAAYRKERLDEISKREEVVRNRIVWWQEQEKVRLEIEQKKAEAEAIEQQILEAEALREKLRDDAMKKIGEDKETNTGTISIDADKLAKNFSDVYELVDIKGVKGVLKARLRDLGNGVVITAQVNDTLPSGHIVKNITKDSIFVAYGNMNNSLSIVPGMKPAPQTDSE
ncbi:MAG: hypothetical protein LBU87_00960 [Lactobacillales bacterium]|jgi:hypothetical protein|nr:hypothetical protein [Lactobacillales bacterium]